MQTKEWKIRAAVLCLCLGVVSTCSAKVIYVDADTAVVHFRDGQIHDIDYEIGQVEVDYATPGMQTRVNMFDGAIIGGDHLEAWEDSLIYIYGGVITGELVANQRARVHIHAGYIRDDTFVRDYAHVHISGGRLGDGHEGDYLSAADNSHVTIRGWDFAIDGQPVGYGELTGGGILTGTLSSGESIDIRIYLSQHAKIVLIPRTLYVDGDASGANDGTSWADAYFFLQDALMSAAAGDEIRVAQGIYRPDDFVLSLRPNLGRAETFQLVNGVTLEGGYAGLGEGDPNARDIELYETILSGDRDGNDVELPDPRDLIGDPSRAENCYHVVTAIGTDANTVLDGFTVTAGNADLEWEHESGGGMILDSADPVLINCTFRRNSACTEERGHAGGLASGVGSPMLTGCTFIENVADTEIRDHGGGNGGGMSGGNATLIDCRFIRNVAAGNDGGAIGGGGNTLTNCLFFENSARTYGGAVYGSCDMTGCTFIGNEASSQWGIGGAVYGSGDMTGCTFIGNRAGQGAGALRLGGRDSLLINCLFAGNAAKGSGGGILIYPNGDRTLLNCTFAGNRASAGRALASGSHTHHSSNIALTNCILRDGGDEIANFDGSTMTIGYANLQGGQASIQDPCNAVLWGHGNLDADPCFAEPGYWDPNETPQDANDDFWLDGDYHLKSQAGRWAPNSETWVIEEVTSPCIDAGDPASPIGPEPFPNGGIVNMGAHGGTAEASKSYFGNPPCETIVAGDINGDCEIDFRDFCIMALHWCEDHNL